MWQALSATGAVLSNGKRMMDVDVGSPRPAYIVRYGKPAHRWYDLRGTIYPLTRYFYSTDMKALADKLRVA